MRNMNDRKANAGRPRRRPAEDSRPRREVSEERAETRPEGEFIAGRNPAKEALEAGRPINKAWLLQAADGSGRDKRLRDIEALLKEAGVTIHYADRKVLDRLADGSRHQGVVLQAASHAYADAQSVLAAVKEQGKDPLVLILDGLQDGRNLGAALRIADGFGVDLVVIPERRSVSLDQYVAKASAGAIEHVPVAREVNLTRFVLDLKEQGFWVYGTAAEGSKAFYNTDLTGPCAIVIGSEGKGISAKLKEHCDLLLSIPMCGKLNSLNASVACGIVLFEAAKQRLQKAGRA